MNSFGPEIYKLYGPNAETFAGEMVSQAQDGETKEQKIFARLFCTLCFTRWFNNSIFDAAIRALGIPGDTISFEEFGRRNFVNTYGSDSFCVTDSVRYAVLSKAIQSQYFLNSGSLQKFCRNLRSVPHSENDRDKEKHRLDTDEKQLYLVEAIYIEAYFAENLANHLLSIFKVFLDWRREPYFKGDLNRRLIKAYSDHFKTGLLNRELHLDFYNMMKLTISPWNRCAQPKEMALRNLLLQPPVSPLVTAYCERELAIARSERDDNDSIALISSAVQGFLNIGLDYWAADTMRHHAKILLESGDLGSAKEKILEAKRLFLNIQTNEAPTHLLTSECMRLYAWAEYFQGADHQETAFKIARKEISNLLSRGELYQAALFKILLAREAWLKHDFEVAIQHYDDAEKVLFPTGDSIDLANCYLSRAASKLLMSEATKDLLWNRTSKEIKYDLERADALFEKLNSKKSVPQSHYWNSVYHYLSDAFDDAIRCVNLALIGFARSGDKSGVSDALFRKATYEMHLGLPYSSILNSFSHAKAAAIQSNSLSTFSDRIRLQVSLKNEPQNILVSVARDLDITPIYPLKD